MDVGWLEECFERLSIELRKSETGRAAADVAQRLDGALHKGSEKIGKVEVRMANGEKAVPRGGRRIHEKGTWRPSSILPEGRRDGKRRPASKMLPFCRPARASGSDECNGSC